MHDKSTVGKNATATVGGECCNRSIEDSSFQEVFVIHEAEQKVLNRQSFGVQ